MIQFYNLLDKIKDELRQNPNVFTVTYGDIFKVDLDKTTIYPISHLNVSNVNISERTMVFTLQLLCLDIVDYNKNEEQSDVFYGNTNLHDILNTQLGVVNDIVSKLKRGSLFSDNVVNVDDVSVDPFYDRFENELAGWGATINIQVPNNISIC